MSRTVKNIADEIMEQHSGLFKKLAEYEVSCMRVYYSDMHDRVGLVDVTWRDPSGHFEVLVEFEDGKAQYKNYADFLNYWALIGDL